MTNVKQYRIGVNLDDDQYVGIGKVIATFSLMEFILDQLIAKLFDLPVEISRLSSSRIRFTNDKTAIVRDLFMAHKLEDQAITEWKVVEGRIDSLHKKRNNVAHGVWHQDSDGNWHAMRYIQDERSVGKLFPYSPADLSEIHNDLIDTIADLIDWIDRWSNYLSESSPDKLGSRTPLPIDYLDHS